MMYGWARFLLRARFSLYMSSMTCSRTGSVNSNLPKLLSFTCFYGGCGLFFGGQNLASVGCVWNREGFWHFDVCYCNGTVTPEPLNEGDVTNK